VAIDFVSHVSASRRFGNYPAVPSFPFVLEELITIFRIFERVSGISGSHKLFRVVPRVIHGPIGLRVFNHISPNPCFLNTCAACILCELLLSLAILGPVLRHQQAIPLVTNYSLPAFFNQTRFPTSRTEYNRDLKTTFSLFIIIIIVHHPYFNSNRNNPCNFASRSYNGEKTQTQRVV
jgi:hypothetical protein